MAIIPSTITLFRPSVPTSPICWQLWNYTEVSKLFHSQLMPEKHQLWIVCEIEFGKKLKSLFMSFLHSQPSFLSLVIPFICTLMKISITQHQQHETMGFIQVLHNLESARKKPQLPAKLSHSCGSLLTAYLGNYDLLEKQTVEKQLPTCQPWISNSMLSKHVLDLHPPHPAEFVTPLLS